MSEWVSQEGLIFTREVTLIIHALTILHGQQRVRFAEIIHNFEDSLFDELISLLNFGDSLNYTEILIQNHLERAIESLEFFSDLMQSNCLNI